MGRLIPLLLLMGVLVAGCGGGKNAEPSTTTTTTTTTGTTTATVPAERTALRVYLLQDGAVAPALRRVPGTTAVAAAALDALVDGLSADERTGNVWSTDVPAGTSYSGLALSGGTARLELDGALPRTGLAQVVYTLTQFPSVKAVEIAGTRYTRADFEAQTPPILVESPLPGQQVTSPLRVTGTANTFEATFEYDLDLGDERIAHHFVTATSGSGTRGTFDFSVPFSREGAAVLTVFEVSAEDGSRIHERRVPVYLAGRPGLSPP